MLPFKKILEESKLLKEGLNVNGLKPGDKIIIKYGRTSFAAEFKGFTDGSEKYSEKVVFKTHAELLKHYGVKSIKELEANFDQKGDNYGKHPYMIVKEIENGSIISLYPYNGFWAVGSSANRASFEKLEESVINEMAGDIEIVKQIDDIRNQLNKIDKNINLINSGLNNKNLDKASNDVIGAIGYLKKALNDIEFK